LGNCDGVERIVVSITNIRKARKKRAPTAEYDDVKKCAMLLVSA
jgi:hypothetical protein